MWSAILNVGGWAFFYLLVIFYVRWSLLEQAYFSHEDPENWEGLWGPDVSPSDHRYHTPAMGLPAISSVGRPA